VETTDNRIRAPRVVHRLRECRRAKGLTQEQLARRAGGITTRTIQRIEAGEPCYRDTLLVLAEALECAPSDLSADEPVSA
jgi:transcriptional regulator with XRE-family HTH domain